MNDVWHPRAKVYDPLKAGSIDGTDTEPHDHGIVRALQSEYRVNDLVVGDARSTLFVGRLNPQTTEKDIKKFFSQFGKIRRYRLVRDIVTGFSKRYGFVEYKDERDACRAHRDAYQAELDGNTIFVDFEYERTLPGWIPRRLGGGFGGNKESGQLRFGGRDRPFKKPILLNQKSKLSQKGTSYHKKKQSWDGHQSKSDGHQNKSYNEREDRHNDRKRKHKKHDRSRSRSRSRSKSRERKKDRHRKKHKS